MYYVLNAMEKRGLGILLSFLPWIAFWVIGGSGNSLQASLISLAIVLVLSLRNIKKVKILDIGTLGFFTFLTVSSYLKYYWVDSYSTILSNFAMFLIVSTSLLIKKPFTIQYAYEQVEERFWKTKKFYRVNFIISSVWCLAFGVNTIISYIISKSPATFEWIIYILVLVGAVKFSSWYPKHIKKNNGET